jgi:transcriptional regulator with GAF, ATPase, and Fis domain
MCGNVLKGSFDPRLPYFTNKGSFWTNSTTQLLKSNSDNIDFSNTRNMCNYSGYESVALIPLRINQKTLGLIQLNDPRKDMFSLNIIENYELIADHAASIVLNTFNVEEDLNVIFDLIKKFQAQNF